jgi:hypothetical protein
LTLKAAAQIIGLPVIAVVTLALEGIAGGGRAVRLGLAIIHGVAIVAKIEDERSAVDLVVLRQDGLAIEAAAMAAGAQPAAVRDRTGQRDRGGLGCLRHQNQGGSQCGGEDFTVHDHLNVVEKNLADHKSKKCSHSHNSLISNKIVKFRWRMCKEFRQWTSGISSTLP